MLNLQEIPRVKTISKEDFVNQYLKPQKPVVVEQLTADWPAYEKWQLSYISENSWSKRLCLCMMIRSCRSQGWF